MLSSVSNLIGKNQTSTKIALVATGLLAAGTAAYFLFGSSKASSDLLPAVTEEEAERIMTEILKRIKLLVPRMLKGAEGIKQQLAAQGQEIDDAQLMKMFILPHVDTGFADIQTAVLEESNVDDDELEEAVEFYKDNETLTKIAEQIKKIYSSLGGDVPVEPVVMSEKAQKVSKGAVIEMLQTLAEKMSTFTEIYCKNFTEENGLPRTAQAMQMFQMGLMQSAESAEATLLEDNNLTTTEFQAILEQHKEDPALGEVFGRMQMDQMRIMQKYGIQMGM